MNRIQEVTERLNVFRERLHVARQCPIVDDDQIKFYQDEIIEMESEIIVNELIEEMNLVYEERQPIVLRTDCYETVMNIIHSSCEIISIDKRYNWFRLRMFWTVKFIME